MEQVHAANVRSSAAPTTNTSATASHAESLRRLVRKSQAAMTAGVFAGEAIKKITSPNLDLATQVGSPEKLSSVVAEVAADVKVHAPVAAFGAYPTVTMSAVAWYGPPSSDCLQMLLSARTRGHTQQQKLSSFSCTLRDLIRTRALTPRWWSNVPQGGRCISVSYETSATSHYTIRTHGQGKSSAPRNCECD